MRACVVLLGFLFSISAFAQHQNTLDDGDGRGAFSAPTVKAVSLEALGRPLPTVQRPSKSMSALSIPLPTPAAAAAAPTAAIAAAPPAASAPASSGGGDKGGQSGGGMGGGGAGGGGEQKGAGAGAGEQGAGKEGAGAQAGAQDKDNGGGKGNGGNGGNGGSGGVARNNDRIERQLASLGNQIDNLASRTNGSPSANSPAVANAPKPAASAARPTISVAEAGQQLRALEAAPVSPEDKAKERTRILQNVKPEEQAQVIQGNNLQVGDFDAKAEGIAPQPAPGGATPAGKTPEKPPGQYDPKDANVSA